MNQSYLNHLRKIEAADDMEILAEAMKIEVDSGWLANMQEVITKLIQNYTNTDLQEKTT